MTNTYHKEEKKSSDPLDPQEVFRIHHKDIPKGQTQCKVHAWKKLNDNEIYCPVCESGAIVGIDNIEKYL
jgi:hypothetical protein